MTATTDPTPLVIFDLDGTLANIDHRKHLIEGEIKDHDAFYAACVDDTPIEAVIAVLIAHASAGHEIWIMSGRREQVAEETYEWLSNHVLFRLDAGANCNIVLRAAGDHRPDHIVKAEWLRDRIPRERLLCVYEDRSRVVEMWRAAGIPCFQVAPGDF